jgi:hypothetical protein
MVLLLGIGLGLAWMRSGDLSEPIWSGIGEYYPDTVAEWAQYLIPFLVILSLCITLLQMVHLRRRFRCFWRQAGTVACATAFFVLSSGAVIDLAHRHLAYLLNGQGGLAPSPSVICSLTSHSALDMSRGVGLSIIAVWVYMRATGVSERSSSLLDVMGKALGWAWLLIALLPRLG